MSYTPTAEQQIIIETSKLGDDMVIEAGAGSGKTSTLKSIAEANPSKTYYYLAFNRSVRDDAAKSFPSNVRCFTGHQLAYPSHAAPMRHRMDAKRVWADGTARILGIFRPFRIDEETTISPKAQAVIVNETVENFCKSSSREISARHIPIIPGCEPKTNPRSRLIETILPYAQSAWTDLCRKNGKLNFTHSVYLKQWALTDPILDCDCVLYDEAQDANQVIAGVVTNQSCQKIMVGDRAQAIYGWNGAVDAMTRFDAPHRLRLTKSFRFGQSVADRANRWLPFTGSDMQITGLETIQSEIFATVPMSDPDAILCRTNAGVIEAAIQTQAAGRTAAIVGGTKDIERFCKAAERLQRGQEVDHPDLCTFKSWGAVQEHAKDEGQDIRVLVRLVDNYGTETILNVCANSTTEARADVIVSTAHKAKGREWDRVRINGDFVPPKDEDGKINQAEAMLCYVSVTRAKKALDDLALSFLDRFIAVGE